MHDREIVYISGKITDDPNYREKFEITERILRDGYDFVVINPAKKIDEQLPRKIQMVLSIDALCGCDTIYMLLNWEESSGARAKKAFAESIGINIRYYDSDYGSYPDNADHCVVCGTIIPEGYGQVCPFCDAE